MDPESLKRAREEEKERLRQEIIEELKQEYYLKPKSEKLDIGDIFEKYKDVILDRIKDYRYSQWESIKTAIRKSVCLHFGARQMKDVPKDMWDKFRRETERFIVEYILK